MAKKKKPIKTEAERKRTEKKILKHLYKGRNKAPQERRTIYHGINDKSRSSKELYDLKKKGYVRSIDIVYYGSYTGKKHRHYSITKKGINYVKRNII